jgi:hypothetical protein
LRRQVQFSSSLAGGFEFLDYLVDLGVKSRNVVTMGRVTTGIPNIMAAHSNNITAKPAAREELNWT